MGKIVCVVPSIRPTQMESFKKVWTPLFEKHQVTLITVWDGESSRIEVDGNDGLPEQNYGARDIKGYEENRDLFCRFTDACRNLGFLYATTLNPDYVLTLDDDVVPVIYKSGYRYAHGLDDPIQAHLDVLQKRVPISWMNTAHDTDLYLRGFPYGIREEAPVMLSHGVWVGTPDFDGETQLRLEQEWTKPSIDPLKILEGKHGVPYSLPYFVGPIPRGVSFPLCGMNVMVRREALPYFYFAPMGPDTGITKECPTCFAEQGGVRLAQGEDGYVARCPCCNGSGRIPGLNRFADIFMGIHLKQSFDWKHWACYTGASTVLHTRASDAKKNMEQEKLGREWLELMRKYEPVDSSHPMVAYFQEYRRKRERYETLVKSILGIK